MGQAAVTAYITYNTSRLWVHCTDNEDQKVRVHAMRFGHDRFIVGKFLDLIEGRKLGFEALATPYQGIDQQCKIFG